MNRILPWMARRVIVVYNIHIYIIFSLVHKQGAKSLWATPCAMEHESSPISHEKSLRAWIAGWWLDTPGQCTCPLFTHSTPQITICIEFALLLHNPTSVWFCSGFHLAPSPFPTSTNPSTYDLGLLALLHGLYAALAWGSVSGT